MEANRIDRKIAWAEIKVLERNFKRNQLAISELQKENDNLIIQLGEKLNKIQELAEEFDSIY
jgi:chromosome segregation ATPase